METMGSRAKLNENTHVRSYEISIHQAIRINKEIQRQGKIDNCHNFKQRY